MPEETTLEVPVAGLEESAMAASVDENVMSAVLNGQAKDASAAESRRISRMDQLAADSAAMWTVAMTSPTIMAAMGFRVAQQSGGWPADKGTGTGGA